MAICYGKNLEHLISFLFRWLVTYCPWEMLSNDYCCRSKMHRRQPMCHEVQVLWHTPYFKFTMIHSFPCILWMLCHQQLFCDVMKLLWLEIMKCKPEWDIDCLHLWVFIIYWITLLSVRDWPEQLLAKGVLYYIQTQE